MSSAPSIPLHSGFFNLITGQSFVSVFLNFMSSYLFNILCINGTAIVLQTIFHVAVLEKRLVGHSFCFFCFISKPLLDIYQHLFTQKHYISLRDHHHTFSRTFHSDVRPFLLTSGLWSLLCCCSPRSISKAHL